MFNFTVQNYAWLAVRTLWEKKKKFANKIVDEFGLMRGVVKKVSPQGSEGNKEKIKLLVPIFLQGRYEKRGTNRSISTIESLISINIKIYPM